MSLNLYWGDLHSHCSISYGHGTLGQALARAKQQLDFASVTGHAFWPDMPTDREVYAEIIDYHDSGFATLAKNWDELIALHKAGTVEGEFVALPSYEWHSLKYGDHNVYGPVADLPLKDAVDLPAMREVAKAIGGGGGVAIPHHIGYRAGYRGINWAEYDEDCSPFVEMFSLHGCSLSTEAAYPMLHDMGPRDYESTAEYGWELGHKFGIVGGTDHHAAYPGSHGDGRMGVFAEDLTREGLMDAFKKRRVYAATGDKIDARMFIEDAWVGDVIKAPGKRRIKVVVKGVDTIDQVVVKKNNRVISRTPELKAKSKAGVDGKGNGFGSYRLRVTWGWGRKTELVNWLNRLTVSEGEIRVVDTCFSGQAVVAPKTDDHEGGADMDEVDLPHEVLETSGREVVWRSVTSGNLTMRHATTQGLSLLIDAPLSAKVKVDANGEVFEYALGDLVGKGRSHFLRGWLTEAIQIGPAAPLDDCVVEAEFEDEGELETDVYRLEVSQKNGHWAWLTPIWVES